VLPVIKEIKFWLNSVQCDLCYTLVSKNVFVKCVLVSWKAPVHSGLYTCSDWRAITDSLFCPIGKSKYTQLQVRNCGARLCLRNVLIIQRYRGLLQNTH
jgi:hypothetical protein